MRVDSHPSGQDAFTRRAFLAAAAAVPAALSMNACAMARIPAEAPDEPPFRISLAQWSLHRALQAGEMTTLDFPRRARREFGIEAVEYVNSFFKDKARDAGYLSDLHKRCDDLGVRSLLIMCDGEGALGDADDVARTKAVENHYRWVEAAKALGCHSIRVNAQSSGTAEEQRGRVADGLHRLTTFASAHEINVIVENHGGLSSDGAWLASVMTQVNHERCGTLPDFGNFRVSAEREYDRYKGVEELMPFAKAVSAKSHDFDAQGNETHTDYRRMISIVLSAGYRGWIGVEYEGSKEPEPVGIVRTRCLLERVREELAQGERAGAR